MRVLIVDDMELARQNIRTILEREGIEVYEAENGEEALKYKGNGIDVVLLDIDLPGINGIEVLKEIRKNNKTVNVVIITGMATSDIFQQSIKYQASCFLTKPLNINALTKYILELKKTTA